MPVSKPDGLRACIHVVVRRIPRGRVASYGQVAREAGLASHARLVGYAMAALPDDSKLPWHRVVNAQGRISPRGRDRSVESLQRALLRDEGVHLRAERIDLKQYRHR